MTFPEALAAVISENKIVTRTAWHGEIFIYVEKANRAVVDENHALGAAYPDYTRLAYHAYLAMKIHGGSMPWTPGQMDIFADDWSVVAV